MVAVALFDKFKITDHLCFSNSVTDIGPVLMTVDSLKLDRSTVHKKYPALISISLKPVLADNVSITFLPFFSVRTVV